VRNSTFIEGLFYTPMKNISDKADGAGAVVGIKMVSPYGMAL